MITHSAREIAKEFGPEYWRKKEENEEFAGELMSFAAASVCIARLAISKAVDYSKQRKVFGDVPIGSYQALQFPIAEAYAALEAAKLLNFKTATHLR